MKAITQKLIALSVSSVMALSTMTTTVAAEEVWLKDSDNNVPKTNIVEEYNPLGYDWDEFFSCNNNSYESYAPYTISEEMAVEQIVPFSVKSTTYENEANNSISTANVLSKIETSKNDSVQFKGKISSTSDTDYIKITPPRHGVLQIKLTPPNNTCLGMYLYNSSGNLLNSSNGQTVATRSISVVTTKKSTLDSFYIRVTPGNASNNTSTNYYTVSLQYVNKYSSLNAVYPFSSASGNNIYINSPVGYRASLNEYHTGLDIASTWDCEVKNIVSGTVLAYRSSGNSSTPNYVVVKADKKDPITGNDIYVRYYHLNSVSVSSTSTSIAAGASIGTVGNTGLNQSGQGGKHLHIDMNCVPSSTGDTIRNTPNRIINPIDLYNYSFSGNVY